ncbi:MAG: porin [Pseudomonadota bacterium]
MKVLALLALALAVLAPAAAQDGVRLFGRLDASIDRVNGRAAVLDNNSHLGLAVSEALAPGLTALAGLDAGVALDSGAASTPLLRNSYLGLAAAWGTLVLGHLDFDQPTGAPVYTAMLHEVDLVAHDGGASAIGAFLNGRNRVNGALGYLSPPLGAWSVRARANRTAGGAQSQGDLGLFYDGAPLSASLALARDTRQGGLQAGEFAYKWQAGAALRTALGKFHALAGVDHYRPAPGARGAVRYWLAGWTVQLGERDRITSNTVQRTLAEGPRGRMLAVQSGLVHTMTARSRCFLLLDRRNADDRLARAVTRSVSAGLQLRF